MEHDNNFSELLDHIQPACIAAIEQSMKLARTLRTSDARLTMLLVQQAYLAGVLDLATGFDGSTNDLARRIYCNKLKQLAEPLRRSAEEHFRALQKATIEEQDRRNRHGNNGT